MQHIGYIFVAIGFLLAGVSGLCLWVGQDIIRNPKTIVDSQLELEPEPLRLLKHLYELQIRYDFHKMIIGKNGELIKSANKMKEDINVIKEFFKLNKVEENNILAFEKLILKIPVTYLRNIPETRLNSPYVLSITPEGVSYLKSK